MENTPETEDQRELLPIIPRASEVQLPGKKEGDGAETDIPKRHLHGFTPVKGMKVEYLQSVEQQPQRKKPVLNPKRQYHAQRADQFGMLLLGCALLIVCLVAVSLYLNNKKYLFSAGKLKPTAPAVVDFYQGNHVFLEKIAEEKAAKQMTLGHSVHGISTVNDDLEVPLSEQMSSMSEKMQKMRALQRADEASSSPLDLGKGSNMGEIKPIHDTSFESMMEFHKDILRLLRTNQ